MQQFIALVHKEPNSVFGVSFPDFPGCITAADTMADAQMLAEEALAFHVDGLIEDRLYLPDPSSLDAIMAEPDNRDGIAVLVPLRDKLPKALPNEAR